MSNVKKYRKLPVEIEAIQWTGHANSTIAIDLFMGIFPKKSEISGSRSEGNAKLLIPTLEGTMEASEGDYIIKGVNGEFYPCKPDIFAKTYEVVVYDDSWKADFKLINSIYDMRSEKYDNTEQLHVEFVHGDRRSSTFFRKEDSVGDIFKAARTFELHENPNLKAASLHEKNKELQEFIDKGNEEVKNTESKWTDAEKEVVLRRGGWLSNFDGNFWKNAQHFRKDCTLHEAFELQLSQNQTVRDLIGEISNDVKSKTSHPLTPEEAFKTDNFSKETQNFVDKESNKINDWLERNKISKQETTGKNQNDTLPGIYELASESYYMLVEIHAMIKSQKNGNS